MTSSTGASGASVIATRDRQKQAGRVPCAGHMRRSSPHQFASAGGRTRTTAGSRTR